MHIGLHELEIMCRQGVFEVPEIESSVDVTSFIQNVTSISNGTSFAMEALLDYQTVTGSCNLSAKFCRPDDESAAKRVVHVLSHGIGFDKSYWDLPYNNLIYSYIGVAVDQYGYCTLSHDRFGVGNSSHADPYTVFQALAEIAALYQLNSMLRKGTLLSVDHAFNESGTIVNVDHSFGRNSHSRLQQCNPTLPMH
ncbi:hypothetical protein GJ744_005473 [Endocarpon pusillum]|uniref:Uncharacterized protein n=1 Tax=Endocarpon pusillum TaxID=364733 RepID=A0A8H7A8G9_9EURO|nr:hypothetical protein GJ744_005473 [Endocarpon pusillum]